MLDCRSVSRAARTRWLTIEARYRPKERRLTAWQKGEITKPENEHFLLVDLYEQVQYRLQLEVVCMDVDQ